VNGLVVADDLGGDPETSAAILEALSAGLVTHASLMATGDAFEDAVARVAAAGVADRIGVHLVLTEGSPLTDPIAACRRFCDADGRFVLWRGTTHVWRLEPAERRAVVAELDAQIARVRSAGIAPSHLDSHHHVHTEWALGAVTIELARRHGVPRVRLARNRGAGLGPSNRLYKAAFNARLRRSGLAGTRWFGNVADCAGAAGSAEVMVHPLRSADGSIVDAERPDVSLSELLGSLASSTAGPRDSRSDL